MASKTPTIGLVENDSVFLGDISSKLSQEYLVKTYHSSEELMNDTEAGLLDLVFLDILLPGMNGVELANYLHSKYPNLKIIMLTGMDSDEMIFNAIQNGAIGYIHKSEISGILETARIVLDGGGIMSPSIAARVAMSFRKQSPPSPIENLSVREKEVVEQILSGLGTREVAEKLGISELTVKVHIKNIYAKLQVKNRVELANLANKKTGK